MNTLIKNKTKLFLALCSIFLGSCRERFTPPPMTVQEHYLVVEGFINAGDGPTTFVLSRTRSLSDTGDASGGGAPPPIYEEDAQVTVEDDRGMSYDLPPEGDGQYGGVQVPVNNQRKYRLHIRTADHEEYLSSFVTAAPAPVIDSIYWELQEDGVHIYFDSYNTGDVTRYYRWTFDETWEIHTPIISRLKYNAEDVTVVARTPEEDVHVCWLTSKSTNILIGNTARLEDNSLSRAPLEFIPMHNEKLSVLYSIKANVFALSKEEFEFWQRMKRNTEEMGTIFAPQPSTVRGNITSVSHPEEPVIGYVAAREMTSKRFFINNRELSPGWNRVGNLCELDTIPNVKDALLTYLSPGYFIPVRSVFPDSYIIAPRPCADCTVRGTPVKPPFWP